MQAGSNWTEWTKEQLARAKVIKIRLYFTERDSTLGEQIEDELGNSPPCLQWCLFFPWELHVHLFAFLCEFYSFILL